MIESDLFSKKIIQKTNKVINNTNTVHLQFILLQSPLVMLIGNIFTLYQFLWYNVIVWIYTCISICMGFHGYKLAPLRLLRTTTVQWCIRDVC